MVSQDEDYWREQEIILAALMAQAAGILEEMIDNAEEGEEVDYWVNLRELCLNGADFFSPPGEPDDGYKGNVISLDRHRAKKNR